MTEKESDKPLLSAAVLGLVFEKINGYRDGSFYTPGFVTMYMARHTLRRAVVRRFTQGAAATRFPELKGCTDWQELRDSFEKKRRAEYAAWFNGLTVLDPAVGSGHFLVSALNELLALKADLKLLLDDAGQYLDYSLRVEHDELLILDNATDQPARYQVAAYDAATGQRTVADKFTRLQAALFREKRALMEHALFGVDLNPNSVRICRLRLWIELLKHAYYRPDSGYQDLETLPNLDLNIRTGNSLVSRHALGAPLGQVFRTAGITVERYKSLVHDYFGASGQAARATLDATLADIKSKVRNGISRTGPHAKRLADAEAALKLLRDDNSNLFGNKLDAQTYAAEEAKRQQAVELRRKELEDERAGVFFQQAFEWRFEFPEVLDDDARFQGFDVVLGNPPYIRQEAFAASKPFFKQRFATFDGKADLYVYFVELGLDLLAPGGELSFIAPNKWLRAGYGAGLRKWLQTTHELVEFLDFGDLPVFAEATTYPAILTVRRATPTASSSFRAAALPKLPPPALDALVETYARPVTQAGLQVEGWNLADDENQALLTKLKAAGKPLKDYLGRDIYYGIKTGLNAAFVINTETAVALVDKDPRSNDVISLFLAGRDIKAYGSPQTGNYLIAMASMWTMQQEGYTIDYDAKKITKPEGLVYKQPQDVFIDKQPAVAKHLFAFRDKLVQRSDMGMYWWELRSCTYYDEFLKPKIVFSDIASRNQFTIDTKGFYLDTSASFIPSDDKYLLAVLNSKAALFFFKSISPSIRGGFLRWKKQYVEQLPIPAATAAQQAEIAALVETILAARAADATADTAEAEAQIDALVAGLYGLTPAEAAVVAGQ